MNTEPEEDCGCATVGLLVLFPPGHVPPKLTTCTDCGAFAILIPETDAKFATHRLMRLTGKNYRG